jgi:class 3 adenylate cyclase
MRPRKNVGRYSVTATGVEKNVDSLGGAINYAQRLCEMEVAETVYVRDTLGDVVARCERHESTVVTYSGRSIKV